MVIVFVSCKKEDSDEVLWEGESYFTYPMEINTSTSLSVDENGNLYYIENPSLNPQLDKPLLHKVDMKGKEVKTYTLVENEISIPNVVYNNKLYYIKRYTNSEENDSDFTIKLYEYSLETNNIQQLYEFKSYNDIKKLEVTENKVYFLGLDNKRIDKVDNITFDKNAYIYAGEVLGAVNIADKSMTELDIECPVNFSISVTDNLVVYGYDSDKGYYFTEYYVNEDSYTDKVYQDLGKLDEFETYNSRNDFVISRFGSLLLEASSINNGSAVGELMPNVSIGRDGIVCKGGYTFYFNFFSKRVERIKTSIYTKVNKTINMVYTQPFKLNPFGCGYTINKKQIDEESFVISALSQDGAHDLYLMDSRQDISENIRDKGAFYTLNDVEGVKEYLDACFPFIKDTAMTADGDVWMLPIILDVPCLIYNEKLCKDNSIDLSETLNFNSFIDKLLELRNDSKLKDKISMSGYVLNENAFYQYLRKYDNFDQEQFRRFVEIIKNKVNYIKNSSDWILNFNVDKGLFEEDNYDFLFTYQYYYEMQSRIFTDELRAGQMPTLTDNKSSIATCTYLCVNPASKQLEDTLAYISSLCKYIMEHNNTMLFKDRKLYPDIKYFDDLYNLYSKADIRFTLPSDLYGEDFVKYMNDEIDLEEFIKEADRKLDIYKNE